MAQADLDDLRWLQGWVRREFGQGPRLTLNPWVEIQTNDPGWAITISLSGTSLQDANFAEIEIDREEDVDWIHCWVDGDADVQYLEWQGRGGDANLSELITVFRTWADRDLSK